MRASPRRKKPAADVPSGQGFGGGGRNCLKEDMRRWSVMAGFAARSAALAAALILVLAGTAAAGADDIMGVSLADGEYSLVESRDGRLWTRAEWDALSGLKPPAKSYGFRTRSGGLDAVVWREYDCRGAAVKETVVLAEAVAMREFGRYFSALGRLVAQPESEVALIAAYPRSPPAIIVREDNGRYLLLRFFPADQRDRTRPNIHTRFRVFTLTPLTAAGAAGLRTAMAADWHDEALTDGGWRKVENFFRPGLHFSEKLTLRRLTDMIVVHHTKIPDMTVESIHDLHLRNGWAGIGYHKVVLPDGRVADGRPEATVGAHAYGVNAHSVGVAAVGDFDVSLPSSSQLAALAKVTAELAEKYGVAPAQIVGHRDVYKDTTCPGRLFPWAEFKQAVAARMQKK